MKEYLLIDGYNVIFAWDNLKKIAEYSLDSAREKLIDISSNYQGFKKTETFIIFDAHLVKGGMRKTEKRNGIFVIYTKEAETADNYIERTVASIGKTYKVRVVTSDALEQVIILGQGATRVSAKEFYYEVEKTEQTIRKNYIKNKPPKNNMLIDNLSPEMAEWFEKMRREKKE